jgi:3-oxoacyl-[acyl-carrier protein] reductase
VELGLNGKIALVTGAGSQIGFGRGIALALAREGCIVVVNDINLNEANQTATEIQSTGGTSMAVKADVSKIAEVRNMVTQILQRFKKIDILVNNAGICNAPKPFVEMAEEEWGPLIEVNLKGVINCTKCVLDQMVARRSGKIISISSTVAKVGGADTSIYGATKGGIAAFTKGIATELAPLGINVNSVTPGPGITGFASKATPQFLEMITKMIPLKKTTTPQDVGNMVAFLASDVAGDITGQIISVDGGMTMC